MRLSVKKFIETCSKTLPVQEPIYEFGALQVDGQVGFADLRPFFPGMRYIGADLEHGPGVDILLDLHKIALPDNSVGMAIACETFEHVEQPRKAIAELYRVIRPGGILIITSHMNFPVHNYPNDYWRFTPGGFVSLLSPFKSRYVDWNGKEENPHTVVGVGVKGPCDFGMLRAMRDEWRVPDFSLPVRMIMWCGEVLS